MADRGGAGWGRAGIGLLLVVLVVSACTGTAPTPQIIYVTPVPTEVGTGSAPVTPTSAPVTPSPTATATPAATTAKQADSPSPTERDPVFGEEPTGPTQVAQVVAVVDGDTIKVRIDASVYSVRYIGIDTPETVHPSKPVERMGKEAYDANKLLVEGRTVVLEKDISETDQYQRLLRYVWLQRGDGWLLVNLELLRLGLAAVTTYPPDVKYVDSLYLPAQEAARAAGVGLWAPEATEPIAIPGATKAPTTNCDPSYPGVCIPPPPPDLDCGEISYRRFKVLPPDPHRFDGDHDGIGCESG